MCVIERDNFFNLLNSCIKVKALGVFSLNIKVKHIVCFRF